MTAVAADETISTVQVAAIADVSEGTMRRWINAGLIAARKVPGTHRVTLKRSDLEKFLAGVPVVPQADALPA